MNEVQQPNKSLWPDYLDKIEWKVAVKAGVTAALSFLVSIGLTSYTNRPDNMVSGLWCILTSIVVLQPHVGSTYRAASLRFLGILVGSILGAMFTSWFGSSPLPLGFSVACTVAVCSLLNLADSFRIAAMSVAVIMVLWGMQPDSNPWVFSMYRFFDSCIGIIVAVIVTHTLWPAQATSTVQFNIAKGLQLLSQLFLNGANLESPKEHLDKIAEDDVAQLSELIRDNMDTLDDTKLELFIRRDGIDVWKALTSTCESLFEQVSTLRSIDKKVLSMIIDDELARKLETLIDQTDTALKALSKQLEKNAWIGIPLGPQINRARLELQEDLLRFRSTKATRKFELQDVEGFFVFFYTLTSIAEQIPKLEDNIKKILLE